MITTIFVTPTGTSLVPEFGYAVNTLDAPASFSDGDNYTEALGNALAAYPRHDGPYRVDITPRGFMVRPVDYVEVSGVATIMAMVRHLITYWDFARGEDVPR